MEEPKCSLLEDLWSMYKNQKFCDVTIVVKDKEFMAHKGLLATRSPVFSAMLEHEMQESKLNTIYILDIDPEVFEEMMHYMYTGETPNIKGLAENLLAAADKYQLEKLKVICANTLKENLSVDNVAEILILADLHNIDKLKAQALEFISTHAKDVVKTEGYKLIAKSYPTLLAEAYEDLAAKILPLDEQENSVQISNKHPEATFPRLQREARRARRTTQENQGDYQNWLHGVDFSIFPPESRRIRFQGRDEDESFQFNPMQNAFLPNFRN